MKSRVVLLNASLVLASAIVAFLAVEGMVRLAGVTGDRGRFSAYLFDRELGWRTKKEFKHFRSTAAYGHFTFYDRDGFPTDEQGLHRALSPDAPSVALVGDSFVEGYYLPYASTFAYLLDEKLTQKQVINLGVSGYAPDQYLLSARAHLTRFNVTDIVVLLFSGNDMESMSSDRMQGYGKPVFGARFDRPINTPLVDSRDTARSNRGLVQRVEDVADLSATFRLIKPRIGRLLRRSGFEGTFTQNPVVHSEAAMKRALGLIKQIQIESPVERFLVYFVPVMEEVEAREPFERNLELLARTCTSLDLPCYSLKRVLDRGAAARQIFTPGEGHFSADGSRRVADDVYDILMAAQ